MRLSRLEGACKGDPFQKLGLKEHEVCFPLDAIDSKTTIAGCYKHFVFYPVLRECRKPKVLALPLRQYCPKSICFLIHIQGRTYS